MGSNGGDASGEAGTAGGRHQCCQFGGIGSGQDLNPRRGGTGSAGCHRCGSSFRDCFSASRRPWSEVGVVQMNTIGRAGIGFNLESCAHGAVQAVIDPAESYGFLEPATSRVRCCTPPRTTAVGVLAPSWAASHSAGKMVPLRPDHPLQDGSHQEPRSAALGDDSLKPY